MVSSFIKKNRVKWKSCSHRFVRGIAELSARALMVKGTKGYLMDGHCRDVEEIIDAGFPVFCRLTTAADIVERWKYNSLGNPITIGTVTIRSGDYIVADMDGAVIVPQEVIEEVVDKTEKVMLTESEMRSAILEGMDPEKGGGKNICNRNCF